MNDNAFYFIGNSAYSYRPFGGADANFSWSAFTRWLAEERNMGEWHEDFHCVEYEPELVTDADGEVIGSFGTPLAVAPTKEEIEKWQMGE